MWNRIKQLPGIKGRTQEPTMDQSTAPSSSSVDVLNTVREQHPNMSVFHDDAGRPSSPAPPMPDVSPIEAKGSRRFTLKPKKRDDDSLRIRSPSPGPQIGLPKKKSSMSITIDTQRSISKATAEPMGRRPSQDMLRPSVDSGRTTPNVLRRPSLDILRSLEPSFNNDDNARPSSPIDNQFGSVRSILREPNTPGTGQNVRFFSRDAYKVMTPDQSMDTEAAAMTSPLAQVFQPPAPPPPPKSQPPSQSRAASPPPRTNSLSPIPRSPKSQRPTLNEVFSPLGGVTPDSSMSLTNNDIGGKGLPTLPSSPNSSNIFDVSQDFDLPTLPPGLTLDLQGPSFNGCMDSPMPTANGGSVRTSTPYVNKGKGKERLVDEKENRSPVEINEEIFHAREKSPRLPPVLTHERSQSFSIGQSVFFSMDDKSNKSNRSSGASSVANRSSNSSAGGSIFTSEKGSMDSPSPSPTTSSIRSRSRALSDTMFHSMLSRGSGSISKAAGSPPESDINDESSADLVVYSPKRPEPDPFSVNATTYYTPQTMIPVTPPRGAPTHVRQASKEETAIFALQNQLAMREELCGQYETDLRAREELVELLGKKLRDVEKEETRRRGILRGWKKKVVELEQTCHYLEDQVESSRQDSMDRSALDEASGFALAAMQEQIATLHRERSAWQRKEEMFRDQIDRLDGVAQEKTDEVAELQEKLWKREESERELQRGILAAQEQMDQLSNTSIGLIDEEELRKAMQQKEEDKERFEETQLAWEQERAEFELQIERYEIEKAAMRAEVETAKKEVKDDQDELHMLKAELDSQWRHTETMTGKIEALEGAKTALERQRGDLQQDIGELHKKIDHMEVDYNDSANKCADLERQLSELWDRHADLEHEKTELQNQLNNDQVAQLSEEIEERDRRIQELMQRHDEDLDAIEASHVTNQANLREELGTQLAQARDEHHAELSRLKQERDAEKAETQARHRREEEKAYHEKMAVRQERDRALQDVARLEDAVRDGEGVRGEVEALKRQVMEMKSESASKELKITQLQRDREKDRADAEGLNMALESKQQELQLIKRSLEVKGTAGATPARPNATTTARRQSTMATPRSRPSSVISDSGMSAGGRDSVLSAGGRDSVLSAGGRDSVMSTASTRNTTSTSTRDRQAILAKSARMNSFGTPTPATTNKLKTSVSARSSVESISGAGSMGPPARPGLGSVEKRGSVTGTPSAARVSMLGRSTSARPSVGGGATPQHQRSVSGSMNTPQRRVSSVLAKARAPPTGAPSSVGESESERELEKEKENLKERRAGAKVGVAA